MSTDTPYELDRFQTFYTKEPETISWIETLFRPKDVLYDIGANVGVFSLFTGIFHKKSVKIFAFEPCYHNFNTLCRNIIINGLSGTVNPFCSAISDRAGFDVLNVISNISGSSGHHVGVSADQMGRKFLPELEQGIACIALDELVKKFNLPLPNHIKIDTDGFEEKILKGGKSVLKNPRLKSILIEVTDINGAGARIERFMQNYNFGVSHPINFQKNHSRFRREKVGKGMIKNKIFTRK